LEGSDVLNLEAGLTLSRTASIRGTCSLSFRLRWSFLLTFPETIEETARAAGRDIRCVQISPEQYASLLEEQKVPAEFISLMNDLFTEVPDGRNAHLTDGVERALNRPPRDFSEYSRKAAASGIWSGVQRPQALA
jgi:hypothetical protein